MAILGTGVAVEVAQNKNFAGIILESLSHRWLTLENIIIFICRFCFYFKDRYENHKKKLKNIKIPILVMYGENDKIVPFQMGKKFFQRLTIQNILIFPKDDDHMMEYKQKFTEALNKFFLSMNQFLEWIFSF